MWKILCGCKWLLQYKSFSFVSYCALLVSFRRWQQPTVRCLNVWCSFLMGCYVNLLGCWLQCCPDTPFSFAFTLIHTLIHMPLITVCRSWYIMERYAQTDGNLWDSPSLSKSDQLSWMLCEAWSCCPTVQLTVHPVCTEPGITLCYGHGVILNWSPTIFTIQLLIKKKKKNLQANTRNT